MVGTVLVGESVGESGGCMHSRSTAAPRSPPVSASACCAATHAASVLVSMSRARSAVAPAAPPPPPPPPPAVTSSAVRSSIALVCAAISALCVASEPGRADSWQSTGTVDLGRRACRPALQQAYGARSDRGRGVRCSNCPPSRRPAPALSANWAIRRCEVQRPAKHAWR